MTGPAEVEDRELIGICADQEEERVHRRLGEAEAELDPRRTRGSSSRWPRPTSVACVLAHLGHIYTVVVVVVVVGVDSVVAMGTLR